MSLTKINFNQIKGAVINALDFGMSPSSTDAVNTAALQAAIASTTPGVCVYIPSGEYQMVGDTTWSKSVEIRGDNAKYAYAPLGLTQGTTLVFTSGTNGFNLPDTTSDFSTFRDITIDGSSTLSAGVLSVGCKQFQNVTIQHFVGPGFYLTDFTNSSVIENCGAFDNGIGIKAAGTAITPFTIRNTNIRRNYTGLTIESGTLVKIDKCIIESNTYLGLYINGQVGQSLGQVTIDSTWFENNGYVTGDYAVIVQGSDVYNIEFRNCLFDTPNYHDVHLQSGSSAAFYRCRFSLGGTPNVLIDAGVANTQFFMCDRGLGQTKNGVTDNGTGTFIQDYPFHILGRNLVEGVNWVNSTYSGFTQTAGKITAANGSLGVANQAIGQTYKDVRYFVKVSIYVITGQAPTLTVISGDGTTVLGSSTVNATPGTNGYAEIMYTETHSGTGAKLTLTNTGPCSYYMNYATVDNETTTGSIDFSGW